MSKSESPTDKDSLKKTSRPTIEELSGTLFMLAVVSDEDDAATLRADLKRSRLDEYKLQRCATAKDARNMLRACTFDLLILQLDEFESPESEVERFPLKNDLVECLIRVNGDQMPLRSLELKGRIWKGNAFEETSIIGVIRELPKANELYDRITEANQAIKEALEAREDAFRKADQKLKALAEEFASTRTEAGEAEQEKAISDPSGVTAKKSPPDENKPLSEPDEVLSIDKKAAYKEVSKSITKKKAATPKQESLPFDFAQEPVADYSPPNPAKEGFIGAAMRLVEMARSENAIDASISIADERTIEMEEKKDLLFDILKELLTNVVRHSQAKLCIVSLFRDEDEWVLQVEDDGVGLDEKLKSVNAPLNQIGLFQIRTQLALKGGHLDMVPASPSGLIARVRLPVSIRDAAENN